MQKLFVVLISIIVFFSSCSRHHTVVMRDSSAASAFNAKVNGKRTKILLNNGNSFSANNNRIIGDSLFWYERHSNYKNSASLTDVSRITTKNTGRGALEGLGLGLLGGIAFGAVIGFASGDDANDGDFFELSASEKAILLGVVFGTLGGVVGIPIGAANGSREVYHPVMVVPDPQSSENIMQPQNTQQILQN